MILILLHYSKVYLRARFLGLFYSFYTRSLCLTSLIITLSYIMFADNTVLYKSTDHSSISSLLTAMQSCVNNMKDWSLIYRLQLNEHKTDALLLDSSQFANLPASLQIGQTCVHFAGSACNLDVIFDSSLSIRD